MHSSEVYDLLTNPPSICSFILHIFWKLMELLSDNRKMLRIQFLGCFDPELCVEAALCIKRHFSTQSWGNMKSSGSTWINSGHPVAEREMTEAAGEGL